MANHSETQLNKFKQAAHELETDNYPQHFKERVGRLVKKNTESEPRF